MNACLFITVFFLDSLGAPVAHRVKPWSTDLAVSGLSPAQAEIFSTVNEVQLHTAFHYHLPIILIYNMTQEADMP